MSWSNRTILRRAGVAALIFASAAMFGGCLRPLYGPTASGADMRSELAAIDVKEIPDRIGHYLRSELMFALDGSGQTAPRKYQLEITATVTQTSAVVDSVVARADAATLVGRAPYVLKTMEGGRIIASGTATGTTTYDRTAQRFGNVRAARDAEIRLAKLLAEQIRTRIAATLSSGQ
ncbi:MAG: hypothetical protein ACRCTD_07420 [Beijerinckiaceae bacterium]